MAMKTRRVEAMKGSLRLRLLACTSYPCSSECGKIRLFERAAMRPFNPANHIGARL
jgi:hypothetical protein